MSQAQLLITAVQSCNPDVLRAAIAKVQAKAEAEVQHLEGSERRLAKKNYFNDRLPAGLDITPLHLAAKAYACHRTDPKLAHVFDTMVGDLLLAGASPFVVMGEKKLWKDSGYCIVEKGKTVAEVCERNIPPSLARWMEENCNDNLSQTLALTRWREMKESQFAAGREAKDMECIRYNQA